MNTVDFRCYLLFEGHGQHSFRVMWFAPLEQDIFLLSGCICVYCSYAVVICNCSQVIAALECFCIAWIILEIQDTVVPHSVVIWHPHFEWVSIVMKLSYQPNFHWRNFSIACETPRNPQETLKRKAHAVRCLQNIRVNEVTPAKCFWTLRQALLGTSATQAVSKNDAKYVSLFNKLTWLSWANTSLVSSAPNQKLQTAYSCFIC